MQLSEGSLVVTEEGVAIILKYIQTAWGAKKYKVLISGKKKYMWDKHFNQLLSEED